MERTKALDISYKTKIAVWKRDEGKCVICGNTQSVMPNAHYISRAKSGLGVEQNVVTLCTNLTENKCHYRYDNGTREERTEMKERIREYLISKYPDWKEEDLIYRRTI